MRCVPDQSSDFRRVIVGAMAVLSPTQAEVRPTDNLGEGRTNDYEARGQNRSTDPAGLP